MSNKIKKIGLASYYTIVTLLITAGCYKTFIITNNLNVVMVFATIGCAAMALMGMAIRISQE